MSNPCRITNVTMKGRDNRLGYVCNNYNRDRSYYYRIFLRQKLISSALCIQTILSQTDNQFPFINYLKQYILADVKLKLKSAFRLALILNIANKCQLFKTFCVNIITPIIYYMFLLNCFISQCYCQVPFLLNLPVKDNLITLFKYLLSINNKKLF